MIRFNIILFLFFISFNSYCQDLDSTITLEDLNEGLNSKVDFEAQFPGGNSAWEAFLQKHLKPKVPVKKGAPAGSYVVVVRFIILKDGTITEIVPETSFGYGMEEELIRVIKKSPKWEPSISNNKPVLAFRRQPITFEVIEK